MEYHSIPSSPGIAREELLRFPAETGATVREASYEEANGSSSMNYNETVLVIVVGATSSSREEKPVCLYIKSAEFQPNRTHHAKPKLSKLRRRYTSRTKHVSDNYSMRKRCNMLNKSRTLEHLAGLAARRSPKCRHDCACVWRHAELRFFASDQAGQAQCAPPGPPCH